MMARDGRHVRTRTRMCGRWTTDGGLGIACPRTRSSVTPARGLSSPAAGAARRAMALLVLCCSCGTVWGDFLPAPRLRAWGQGARGTTRFPPLWYPLPDKASQGAPLHLRGGEQRGGGPRPSHQRQRHCGSGGWGGGGGRPSKWQAPVPLYSLECDTPDYRPEAEDASTCKAAIARMGRHKF
jgi:hypothetical protein